MNQPVLGVRGTAEYVKATGEGTAESPYIPVVQVEGGGGGGGGTTNVDFGTKITDATMPAGGAGVLGWLSAIWKLISDRIPVLSNGKIPVDVANLNTSVLALESGGNLAGINSKLPSDLTVSATRLLVDGSGVTQPVSMTTAPPGLAYLSTATITRSANTTAYIANDVYGNGSSGNAFELTNIGPSGGFVFLSSLDIIFNITALPTGMGAFAVYLFNAPPSSAITDNLPYSLGSGDRATIITLNGISLTASLARGGGSVVAETLNINQLFKLATGSTSLWGYLVTLSAFTPAANSETGTIRARSFAP